MCIYPSIYLSIYLSIHISIHLSIYLSIYISIYLSIYLSILECAIQDGADVPFPQDLAAARSTVPILSIILGKVPGE